MNRKDGTIYVITATSVLHLAWTILLVLSASTAFSTPVSGVISLTGSRYAAAITLGAAALLALFVGWLYRSERHSPATWTMTIGLVPQQFLLLVSALSGIRAIAVGHYSDGTARAWEFIAGDQLPVIIITLLYTTAILAVGPYPRKSDGEKP
jgi:hypothetical protein